MTYFTLIVLRSVRRLMLQLPLGSVIGAVGAYALIFFGAHDSTAFSPLPDDLVV
jgi:hypothetical protein